MSFWARRPPRRAVVGVAAAALAAAVPGAALAAQCGFDDVVSAYRAAVELRASGDARGERDVMGVLAEGGFAPAARILAEDFASGQGGAKDREAAALWAARAAGGGDATAAVLLRRLGPPNGGASWHARRLMCDRPGNPRLAEGAVPPAASYVAEMASGLSRDTIALAQRKLPELFAAARDVHPAAPLYLSLVAKIQIVPGDRYDRYIGWKDGEEGSVLRISAGNFLDTDSRYAARALVAEIARRVYRALNEDGAYADSNVEFYDIGGKTVAVYGTVYPDVPNLPFFRIVRHALRMAEGLPPELRRFAEAIEEIRYSPPSKFFTRSGPLDITAAYYNRSLGEESNRIVFVRRKAPYLSALLLAGTFVHEGTHIDQHLRAAAYRRELPALRAAMAELSAAGEGGGEAAAALRRKIADREDMVHAWYQGVQAQHGRIQDIRFECEATLNEIEAMRALEAAPSVMNGSGYLKLCPAAQRMLVEWQDGTR